MVNGNSILWQLLFLLVLMFINSFFTGAEVALISLNKNKLEKMSGETANSRRASQAKRILSLIRQPAKFIASVQVAITLAGFMSSAFAADNFSGRLTQWLVSKGTTIPVKTLSAFSLVGITLILSFLTIVLCELLPKRLALKKAETLAFASSGIVLFASRIFAPVVWFLTKTTNVILALIGISTDTKPDEITEEEIRLMIDVGSARGAIKVDEMEILHNVFEFDNKTAAEVMTHRRDTILLHLADSDQDWEKTIIENRHSFFPVCGIKSDDIRGVLISRDYFCLRDRRREIVMAEAVTPAQFIPTTVKTDVLFGRMKKNRNHFAVVLDERGGMMGIVTMKDLLEELVGSLEDDHSVPPEQPLIEKTGPNTWIINGAVSLDKAARELDLSLPLERYDTFGGYVFSLLGRIPEDGIFTDGCQADGCQADGCQIELEESDHKIKILEIREHRLEKALVSVKKNAEN